jgi:hypothetical protein
VTGALAVAATVAGRPDTAGGMRRVQLFAAGRLAALAALARHGGDAGPSMA